MLLLSMEDVGRDVTFGGELVLMFPNRFGKELERWPFGDGWSGSAFGLLPIQIY